MSTLHLPDDFIVLHAESLMQASLQGPAQSGGTAMQLAAGALEATAHRVSTTYRNDHLVSWDPTPLLLSDGGPDLQHNQLCLSS